MSSHRRRPVSEELYSRTAERAAAAVIAGYSTSFGLATKLLGPTPRRHIRNIYALVRIADEIVDGLAAEAGLSETEQSEMFEHFVSATRTALCAGISDDLIIHAFARTARAAGITTELVEPFFASMRTDLVLADTEHGAGIGPAGARVPVHGFDAEAHAEYVYGSAEVVGLMCLKVFLIGQHRTPAQIDALEHGARQLGAAFQNVNFLRDLADDSQRLGRSYLTSGHRLTEAEKTEWVARIRAQLTDAQETIPGLPKNARVAVRCAAELFTALNDTIASTSVERLYEERVRVSNSAKARLAARALLTTAREGRA